MCFSSAGLLFLLVSPRVFLLDNIDRFQRVGFAKWNSREPRRHRESLRFLSQVLVFFFFLSLLTYFFLIILIDFRGSDLPNGIPESRLTNRPRIVRYSKQIALIVHLTRASNYGPQRPLHVLSWRLWQTIIFSSSAESVKVIALTSTQSAVKWRSMRALGPCE